MWSRRRLLGTAVAAAALALSLSTWRAVTSDGRDCGVDDVDVAFTPEQKARSQAVRDCIWQANVDGERAHSTHVRRTVEGDAIITTLRVRGHNNIDVTFDHSRDRFGGAQLAIWTKGCNSMSRAVDQFDRPTGGLEVRCGQEMIGIP